MQDCSDTTVSVVESFLVAVLPQMSTPTLSPAAQSAGWSVSVGAGAWTLVYTGSTAACAMHTLTGSDLTFTWTSQSPTEVGSGSVSVTLDPASGCSLGVLTSVGIVYGPT